MKPLVFLFLLLVLSFTAQAQRTNVVKQVDAEDVDWRRETLRPALQGQQRWLELLAEFERHPSAARRFVRENPALYDRLTEEIRMLIELMSRVDAKGGADEDNITDLAIAPTEETLLIVKKRIRYITDDKTVRRVRDVFRCWNVVHKGRNIIKLQVFGDTRTWRWKNGNLRAFKQALGAASVDKFDPESPKFDSRWVLE